MKTKLRDEIAEILFEELILEAARSERDTLDVLLEDLGVTMPNLKDQLRDLENAAGLYAAALAEAAFLAGLECGRDLRRLIGKGAG